MAAPTVRYYEAGAATLSAWMPKLQELLLDAGWTLEYADADAIGSGSPEAPAWDKTPATNTDAGIAVFRMPANGQPTRWYVRLRPGWNNATTQAYMRGARIGLSHDGSGEVTGAGDELAPNGANFATHTRPWAVAVSEDGFALILGDYDDTPLVIVERARSMSGQVLDDVIAHNKYSGAFAGPRSCHVSALAGLINDSLPLGLAVHSFRSAGSTYPSLMSRDASSIAVIGPYYPGGDPLFAPPRLAFLASPVDVLPGAVRMFNIDGGPKPYKARPQAINASAGIWLVATE